MRGGPGGGPSRVAGNSLYDMGPRSRQSFARIANAVFPVHGVKQRKGALVLTKVCCFVCCFVLSTNTTQSAHISC